MTQSATAQIEIDFLRDEVKRLRIQSKDVSVARELLKRNGYYEQQPMDYGRCHSELQL